MKPGSAVAMDKDADTSSRERRINTRGIRFAQGTMQAEIKRVGFTFKNLSIFFTTPSFTTSSTAEGEAGRTRLSTPMAL